MPKQFFQDIIPPDQKSIKKIPIPQRQHPMRPQMKAPVPEPSRPRESREYKEEYEEEIPAVVPVRRSPRTGFPWKVIIILLVAIGIIGGVVYFMSRVSGARVVISLLSKQVTVDSQFIAVKNAVSENDIQYQTVTVSKDGKMTLEANGEETVDVKAMGSIIVYNNYSSAPQKLVENTRFETPEGLIFKANQAFTVPGKQGTTPGSVEITVTAEKPGVTYNVGLKDFTIPGFKTDPRYKGFYARSKNPIQGGFTGTRPKVDGLDVTKSRAKIDEELKTSLINQTKKDLPEGLTLLPNTYVISYESLPNTANLSGGVEINERATLNGIMFKRTDLAREIGKKVPGDTSNLPDITGVEGLMFTAKTASSSIFTADKITFNLKGTTTLVSFVDTTRLQQELVGKPRKSLNAIRAGYPGIAKIEVTMRPFWKNVFPSNKQEITIIVNPVTTTPAVNP